MITQTELQSLLEKWRNRSVAFEHTLETIDKQKHILDPEESKLITQAHQNELDRCIMELEGIQG